MTYEELEVYWVWRLTHQMEIIKRANLPWEIEPCESPAWYTHAALFERTVVDDGGIGELCWN